jgi:glycosyltransferase involved in cell wall biosynthesis
MTPRKGTSRAGLEVSVVIPALDAASHLPRLLRSVEGQTLLPAEIVIVDTSGNEETHELIRDWSGPVPILYRRLEGALPGEARNVGVAVAHAPWIAFLDCRTYPYPQWLQRSLALATGSGAQFVMTLLECRGETRLKETLIAATYGHIGVRSLPGSLIRKGTFQVVGGFLESVRAGEDIEWMRRVRNSGIATTSVDSAVISYEGFPATIGAAIEKWYSYTLSNARIDVLNAQKIIYSTLCFLFCFLLMYRWNDLFAHWKESSIYYIPNITKMFLALVAGGYTLHRGLVRPLARQVPLAFLLPWRWIEVFFVGLCLDLAKTPGMMLGASILIRKRLRFSSKEVENET